MIPKSAELILSESKPLEKMTIRELKKLAGFYKVKDYSYWTRMELIRVIKPFYIKQK